MKRVVGLLVLTLLASCGTPNPARLQGRDTGSWAELPSSPLSPRYGSQAVAVAGKLYVIGGTAAEPCPPGADCTLPTEAPFRDGSVYDPGTETWAAVADAPAPVGHASAAVVDGKLYLLVSGFGSSHDSMRPAFVSYDPERDSWAELALPPHPQERILTSAGPRVVAFQHSQENGIKDDFVYELGTDEWTPLPPDPLRTSFDRWMVWTDEGLVLLGIEVVPQPGAVEPAVYRAAVLDDGNKWTRFDDSEIIGYNPMWSWTSGRVLNASPESADGGETNNWGRTYYSGGTLDPSTGEWELLPDPPTRRGGLDGINTAGERYSIAYSGWVYDAHRERWLYLARPPGGPTSETAAAWVGDDLYIWGGLDWQGNKGTPQDDGWVWHPAA